MRPHQLSPCFLSLLLRVQVNAAPGLRNPGPELSWQNLAKLARQTSLGCPGLQRILFNSMATRIQLPDYVDRELNYLGIPDYIVRELNDLGNKN